ncbi:MAG: Mut7-C ubiquitin/RNAse domain-containing protein [Spirochaetales bacterium]|nr:Mut7-C ubiquitin/RNAse domain-containing protein [Spirochaetales bacterium]
MEKRADVRIELDASAAQCVSSRVRTRAERVSEAEGNGLILEVPCFPEQTIKDLLESLGVPHVEIGTYCINGAEASSSSKVKKGDSIEIRSNSEIPEGEICFILDVHLGKLARCLRLLGIDSWYRRDYDDREIVQSAELHGRVVLSRDIGLLKRKELRYGYWLRSQDSMEQVLEVSRRFRLGDKLEVLSRCPRCNGLLRKVSREEVYSRLPEKTRKFYSRFFLCSSCGRIYWKGSHYPKIQKIIDAVKETAGDATGDARGVPAEGADGAEGEAAQKPQKPQKP